MGCTAVVFDLDGLLLDTGTSAHGDPAPRAAML